MHLLVAFVWCVSNVVGRCAKRHKPRIRCDKCRKVGERFRTRHDGTDVGNTLRKQIILQFVTWLIVQRVAVTHDARTEHVLHTFSYSWYLSKPVSRTILCR
jgi:hypothetical protein